MIEIELTTNQKQILAMVLDGQSNKEIAAAMKVSIETVKHTVARISYRHGIAFDARHKRIKLIAYYGWQQP